MSAEQWLLLTDYASKYRISVSTLRRRIKNNQIPHRFENGKYFLIDVSPTNPEVTAHQKETGFFPELKTFAVEPAPMRTMAASRQRSAPQDFSEQLNVDLGLPPRAAKPAPLESKQNFETQSAEPSREFNSIYESTPSASSLSGYEGMGYSSSYNPSYQAPRFEDREPVEIFDFELGQAPIAHTFSYEQALQTPAVMSEGPEPLITTATNLLNELKRAYSNILHEKEEQMIQLKEEVSDLKTLVRVLEDETERLRRQLQLSQSRENARN